MIVVTPRHSACALEALAPILNDINYFLHHGGYHVAPVLELQIEQAIEEITLQLIPVSIERLKQLISRLMMHFSCQNDKTHLRLCTDYISMLQGFPEDLLYAAYQHVLKYHHYPTLPKIADLIALMEPELAMRKTILRKLGILQKQVEMGVTV